MKVLMSSWNEQINALSPVSCDLINCLPKIWCSSGTIVTKPDRNACSCVSKLCILGFLGLRRNEGFSVRAAHQGRNVFLKIWHTCSKCLFSLLGFHEVRISIANPATLLEHIGFYIWRKLVTYWNSRLKVQSCRIWLYD